MAWHSWLTVWVVSGWDSYADLWRANWFWALIITLLVWCQCAHCLLQPCCTCLKKENKMKKSLWKGGKNPYGIVSAHRGGGMERIENTMEAFKNARTQGANLLETDVFRTADNVIVCCHDQTLGRLAVSNVKVEETNYADLPAFKTSIDYFVEPGSYT